MGINPGGSNPFAKVSTSLRFDMYQVVLPGVDIADSSLEAGPHLHGSSLLIHSVVPFSLFVRKALPQRRLTVLYCKRFHLAI